MNVPIGKATALGLGTILVVGFVWSQRPHAPALVASLGTESIVVGLVDVSEREIPTLFEASGSLRSRAEVLLAARLTAEVRAVKVSVGASVKMGDVLIELDRDELVVRVAQAEAGLVLATQILGEAGRELVRTQTLFESGARSQRELDRASTEEAVAAARQDAAAQALSAARVGLGYAIIQAPFDGVVAERMVDPGELVQPGRPLLRIFDPSQLRLEAGVSAGLLSNLSVGDKLTVRIDALAGGAGFPRDLVGTLHEIDAAVDPVTRTALVKIALPTTAGALPGMFARALIPVGQRTALIVPAQSVVRRGQIEVVFGLSPDGGRARMQIVRVGRTLEDGSVEILSGLGGLQQVVSRNASQLRDGAALRVEQIGLRVDGPREDER